jgi:hypothetical protein
VVCNARDRLFGTTAHIGIPSVEAACLSGMADVHTAAKTGVELINIQRGTP